MSTQTNDGYHFHEMNPPVDELDNLYLDLFTKSQSIQLF